jgi:hypothetical protein
MLFSSPIVAASTISRVEAIANNHYSLLDPVRDLS